MFDKRYFTFLLLLSVVLLFTKPDIDGFHAWLSEKVASKRGLFHGALAHLHSTWSYYWNGYEARDWGLFVVIRHAGHTFVGIFGTWIPVHGKYVTFEGAWSTLLKFVAQQTSEPINIQAWLLLLHFLVYSLSFIAPYTATRHFSTSHAKVFREGLIWTLFTSTVAHGSAIHLLQNSYALCITVPDAELLLGTTGFLVFYVTAGILVNLLRNALACLLGRPYQTRLGASGVLSALFTLIALCNSHQSDSVSQTLAVLATQGGRFVSLFATDMLLWVCGAHHVDFGAHMLGMAFAVVYKKYCGCHRCWNM